MEDLTGKSLGPIREMEAIRSRALEFAGIGIFRYTLEGIVLFMDIGCIKVLEIDHLYPDPQMVVGKSLSDLFVYVKPRGNIRDEVLKHGKIRNFEYPFKTLNGKLRWSLHDSYLVVDEQTGQQAIQAIARDITKLKETELKLARKNEELQQYKNELELRVESRTRELIVSNQALHAEIEERKKVTEKLIDSERRYKKIFTGAIDGIVVVDSHAWTILQVNPAMCAMLGYTEQEFLTLTMADIHLAEEIPQLKDRMEQATPGESIQIENITCICKDGRRIFVTISVVDLELDGKHRRVGFFSDVTEKKRLTEQLIHSEKLSAVGYLAAGIAHEFNNILMSNQVNLDLLKMLLREEMDLSVQSRQCIQNMSSSIKRGATIVRNIMEFARPREPQKKEVEVETIIDDVLAVHEYLLSQNQIQVTCDYTAHVPLALDPGQLEQVFSNIFINAAHAINSRGSGTIHIVTLTSVDKVAITISDDGIGMSEETKQKAFTPFFTTKSGRGGREHLKGSGLGLSISHQIIEKHGGHISIDSSEHVGTTVTIKLPRRTVMSSIEVKESPRTITSPTYLYPLRMLIIEDDDTIGTQIREVMERMGFSHLHVVTRGLDALAYLEEHRIDVILLDLILPDISGWEVVKRIRARALDIPVLCMSGQVTLHEDIAKELSRFSYLQKPFEISQLLEKLEEIFPPPQ